VACQGPKHSVGGIKTQYVALEKDLADTPATVIPAGQGITAHDAQPYPVAGWVEHEGLAGSTFPFEHPWGDESGESPHRASAASPVVHFIQLVITRVMALLISRRYRCRTCCPDVRVLRSRKLI
jgi:hypothetical protein